MVGLVYLCVCIAVDGRIDFCECYDIGIEFTTAKFKRCRSCRRTFSDDFEVCVCVLYASLLQQY